MPQKSLMGMDLDDAEHHPEDFDQYVALLDFLSDPIACPSNRLMQDNISLEIFVNICYHLPPQDLLTLACVCKNFNNMLNGNLFPICSEIWKSSRERFTIFKDMDPPRGMSQQQFVRLLNFERGCEFCKNKSNIQIYWPANVRACKPCILEKAKTHQELEEEFFIDRRVLNILSHLIPCPDDNGRSHYYYWLPQALAAQSEFDKNSGIAREKKPELQRLTDDSIKRYRWITQCWTEQLIEQKSIVKRTIQNMGLSDPSFPNDPIIEQIFEDINVNPFVKLDFKAYAESLRSLKANGSLDSQRIIIKREERDDTDAVAQPKVSNRSSSQKRHAESLKYKSSSTEDTTAPNSHTSEVYIKTETEPVDLLSGSRSNKFPPRLSVSSSAHASSSKHPSAHASGSKHSSAHASSSKHSSAHASSSKHSSAHTAIGKKNRPSSFPLDKGRNEIPTAPAKHFNKNRFSFNEASPSFMGGVSKSESLFSPVEYGKKSGLLSLSAFPVSGRRKGITFPIIDESKKTNSKMRTPSFKYFEYATPTVNSETALYSRSEMRKQPTAINMSAAAVRPRMNVNSQQPPAYRPNIPAPPQGFSNALYETLLRRDEIIKGLKLVATTDNPLSLSGQKSSVPFTINIRDHLFQFLSLCKVFINPPMFNGRNSGYDREFLYDIILKLQQEAAILKTTCKAHPPPHILDLQEDGRQSKKSKSTKLTSTNSPTQSSPSLLCQIPPELFLQICKNLSPADLLSLTRVCKLFYNDLCHNNSGAIQQIWRESRLKFLPYRKLPPPDGMNERQYMVFLLDKVCQFCGERKNSKILWDSQVRSCKDCFRTRYINCNNMAVNGEIPWIVLDCVPSESWKTWDTIVDAAGPFRWVEQVRKKYEEYKKVPEEERASWVEDQRKRIRKISNEYIKRIGEDVDSRQHTKTVRAKDINEKISQLLNEKDEDGNPMYEKEILLNCVSLKKAYRWTNTFTERAWKILRTKLIKEYHGGLEKRGEIKEIVKTMVSGVKTESSRRKAFESEEDDGSGIIILNDEV
ncbi:5814_t:CDS:2 [Acaulospora colombiana]|uniref:5814_t:CDS:1 n=1 Tax=Acaulospora colombiana TaxID=27376 RepID=A0ACA9K465_9GLOM|nr:5814_t:CDS:2 [Acaulospora colombiana]